MIARPTRLLAKYGLSRADFEALFHQQGGACAICRTPETPDDPLHIDHDHTGPDRHIARGLVCHRCAFDLKAYVHGRLPRRDRRLTRYLFRFWGERAEKKDAPGIAGGAHLTAT